MLKALTSDSNPWVVSLSKTKGDFGQILRYRFSKATFTDKTLYEAWGIEKIISKVGADIAEKVLQPSPEKEPKQVEAGAWQ